jgi:hypothetical protein
MKNLNEIKSKLDKLNYFMEYLMKSTHQISNLDRDTLLAQIRVLYDTVLFELLESADDKKPVETKEPVETEQFIKNSELPKTTILKSENPVLKKEQSNEQTKLTEKPAVQEEEMKNIDPEIIKTQIVKEEENVVIKNQETSDLEKNKQETIAEDKISEPVKVEIKEKKVEPEQYNFNEEFEELFFFKQATDLASKLSEKPIPNLSKALAVNEKLNYVQQLFAGETAKFGEAFNYFNEAASFEIARKYMEINLIKQYNWLSREKKNTAKEFIKLIRRRYL